MNGRIIGRYILCDEIAAGGMASVHFGLLLGDEGFTRTVAIKRLHPQFAKDPEFASALLDEGRLQARVRHPNVAAVLDVVRAGDELLLVMEYLHAAPLTQLRRSARATGERPSLAVLRAVMVGALRGLHAAHEARSPSGAPLDVIHRDISPQNILVGADGVARVVDFGIARAAIRSQITRDGVIKGKPGYMAPEQFTDGPISRAVDIYAAGVVLWELLTSERLYPGGDIVAVARKVFEGQVDPPSAVVPGLPPALDSITAKALARDPAARFATASELADALEALGPLASPGEVAAWVERGAGEALAERLEVLRRIEREAEKERAGAPASSPIVTSMASAPSGHGGPSSVRGPRSSSGPNTASTAVVDLTPSRRSRATSVVVAALALIAAAAGGAALAGRDPRPAPLSGAEATTPLPSALTTTAPVAAEAPPAPSSASAAAAPVDTPATPVSAPPPSKAAPEKRAPQGAVTPRVTAAATSSGPCTTIGKDGIKRWNPRCK